jgi:hypothetical protein
MLLASSTLHDAGVSSVALIAHSTDSHVGYPTWRTASRNFAYPGMEKRAAGKAWRIRLTTICASRLETRRGVNLCLKSCTSDTLLTPRHVMSPHE